MHAVLVIGKGHRPRPKISWPLTWRSVIRLCWSSNLFYRPDFDCVVKILDHELDILCDEIKGKNLIGGIKTKQNMNEYVFHVYNFDIGSRKLKTRFPY